MSEAFTGEIRMFAGTFAPRAWALCDGQLLAVSQNDALFSLFGTIYGGDGRTTFGLPELRGRVPIHQGTGAGLTNRRLGQRAGAETVTPNWQQIPSHAHPARGTNADADSRDPAGRLPATPAEATYASSSGGLVQMAGASTDNGTGGAQSHTNIMPFLCVHYIVALYGVYPSRS
jgi:microcystin-dependent protein